MSFALSTSGLAPCEKPIATVAAVVASTAAPAQIAILSPGFGMGTLCAGRG